MFQHQCSNIASMSYLWSWLSFPFHLYFDVPLIPCKYIVAYIIAYKMAYFDI